ncbi:MAG TPA: hypothetical protein VH109_07755 [Steroidobacteraceae bacterium]|jgi:hypothetical protein|nr:hypothetical protein [Steroidobacteraceae bacterium]
MHSEDATIETPQLQLPADLLAEVSRSHKRRPSDFGVEGMKPTLLERLAQLLGLG